MLGMERCVNIFHIGCYTETSELDFEPVTFPSP